MNSTVPWFSLRRAMPAAGLLLGLYGFVLSLTGLKEAWQLGFSSDGSGTMVQSILNASLATPFTALFSGIVITSLVQSSSATIALIVTTVAAGVISIEDSVYILMGANIGTTITNTIVGLAHAHREDEFARLVPAVLVDDVFKFFNVALFFVLELFTGLLHSLSVIIVDWIAHSRMLGGVLALFPDVIDLVTDSGTQLLISLVRVFPLSDGFQALLLAIVFFALLIGSLNLMGEALEVYLHDRSRQLLDSVFNGKLAPFGIGFVVCWLLQSSSVTVSLILPLVTQNAVHLYTVYYYSIGAALATTCDAGQLLSYLKFGPVGLTAGMVHILLNVFGALLFLLIPGINQLPPRVATLLAGLICRYRHAPALLIAYVVIIFFGLPVSIISIVSAIS